VRERRRALKRESLKAEIAARRNLAKIVTGKRPPRRRRLPRQREPRPIALAYFAELRPMLERLRRLVDARIFPALERWHAAATRHLDALELELRADAYSDEVEEMVDGMARDFFSEFPNEQLRRKARAVARRTSDFNREELGKQFAAALGVELRTLEPWLGDKVDAFAARNVTLIKTLPEAYLSDVKTSVLGALGKGETVEDLAAKLRGHFDEADEKASNKAIRIARTEVGRLNGEMNEARQRELGVDRYVWRTVQDNRVREEHFEREGKSYSWKNPPADGHPGEAIMCRCFAEPDLSEFFGD